MKMVFKMQKCSENLGTYMVRIHLPYLFISFNLKLLKVVYV